MKLTHRDFRPLRRSRYVAQPLKRRPTLRILLLAAIGVTVYLKYDSVVNSKAFHNLRQPRRMLDAMLGQNLAPSETLPAGAGILWAPDSSQVEADCPSNRIDVCLEQWRGLGREPVGTLRSDLEKAKVQWDADAANGIKARFLRVPDATDPLAAKMALLELVRLEIRGQKANLVLEQAAGGRSGRLCDRDRCLDALHPQAPLSRFREVRAADPDQAESRLPADARLIAMPGSAAKPVLRGRVVEAPSVPGSDHWVKIYHGENTFSYYRGLATLKPGLKPGAFLEAGDTLGFMGAGDSATALDLRIEKDGMRVDPYAFMGLLRQAAGSAIAPASALGAGSAAGTSPPAGADHGR